MYLNMLNNLKPLQLSWVKSSRSSNLLPLENPGK